MLTGGSWRTKLMKDGGWWRWEPHDAFSLAQGIVIPSGDEKILNMCIANASHSTATIFDISKVKFQWKFNSSQDAPILMGELTMLNNCAFISLEHRLFLPGIFPFNQWSMDSLRQIYIRISSRRVLRSSNRSNWSRASSMSRFFLRDSSTSGYYSSFSLPPSAILPFISIPLARYICLPSSLPPSK